MEKSESRRNRIGGQMAGLYDLEETIGEGHYAVVKLARHVFTGEKVAVKVIDKMKLDAATRIQMMQEVRLMKLVQHPYVVRLYEVIDTQTKVRHLNMYLVLYGLGTIHVLRLLFRPFFVPPTYLFTEVIYRWSLTKYKLS